MGFTDHLTGSCSSTAYYRRLINTPSSAIYDSAKYFATLLVVATVVFALLWTLPIAVFSPHKVVNDIVESFPKDLRMQWRNHTLQFNYDGLVKIDIPSDLQTSLAGFDALAIIEHNEAIGSTIAMIRQHNAFLLLTEDKLYVYSFEDWSVIPLQSLIEPVQDRGEHEPHRHSSTRIVNFIRLLFTLIDLKHVERLGFQRIVDRDLVRAISEDLLSHPVVKNRLYILPWFLLMLLMGVYSVALVQMIAVCVYSMIVYGVVSIFLADRHIPLEKVFQVNLHVITVKILLSLLFEMHLIFVLLHLGVVLYLLKKFAPIK